MATQPPASLDQPNQPKLARCANRLADESSPYLLQHADNPVHWLPWGEDAFQAARERNVPIFLSIGYATCYWCHVMERESFEDDATAAILNEGFVAVKVDREERPDVDDVYMTATQLMTGGGGWPMSVFLTPPGAGGADDPGLAPFYAGAYFPKTAKQGMPSFKQVLEGVALAWRDRRQDAVQQAERVADAVRQRLASRNAPVRLTRSEIEQALDALLRIHDGAQGGFGRAPKFPQTVFLELLLDARERLADADAADAAARRRDVDSAIDTTMQAMALGGIFDQVGGGFHRYSTDDSWTVPHFEKMLYDQAQLLRVYARRFAQTGEPLYGRVARQTAEYVLREMTTERGAFFAAQDAEVGDREGYNYLWTKEQMRDALDEDDADFAINVFGLAAGPNFRDPHHSEDAPANVLRLHEAPAQLGERRSLALDAFFERLDRVRAQLLEARRTRDQPRTDDKTIAEWTGMMIASLADASSLLDAPELLEAAERAGRFVWRALRDESGALRRTWREGTLGPPAGLADYAQLARGFAAIARTKRQRAGETSGSAASGCAGVVDWVARAQALLDEAHKRFGADDGGWFDVEAGREDLFIRPRTTYDGAIPSGSAVMLHALLDAHELTGEAAHLERAEQGLKAVSAIAAQAPLAASENVRALARALEADDDAAELFADLPPLKSSKRGDAADDDLLARARDAVRIFADRESVAIAPGEPATITIELRIAEGFHITAHEPGVEGLFGAQVRLAGSPGVRAVVHYPEGETLDVVVEGAEDAGSPRVYTGSVQLQVELMRSDEAPAGEPRLEIVYQVCTDRVCLAPVTATLGVLIDAR